MTYQSDARAYATQAGINPDIFVAQIQQESGFNPRATSPAGALGIAQFMPATAAGMGVNPWDPQSALQGAARLDASNLKKYGGDYSKMLAAYNAGSGAVDAATNRFGSAWLSHLPKETQQYVQAILGKNAISASSSNVVVSSSNNILDFIKRWGEYIAVFVLAVVLIITGLLLLAGKQVVQTTKTAVKAAVMA